MNDAAESLGSGDDVSAPLKLSLFCSRDMSNLTRHDTPHHAQDYIHFHFDMSERFIGILFDCLSAPHYPSHPPHLYLLLTPFPSHPLPPLAVHSAGGESEGDEASQSREVHAAETREEL